MLKLQLYLGLCIGELCSREPSYLQDEWLIICPYSKMETDEPMK